MNLADYIEVAPYWAKELGTHGILRERTAMQYSHAAGD